jgi:cyclic pyranopterin monophosphate synthase
MAKSKLTHLDAAGRPAMVDVSAKAVTAREAVAECRVKFPLAVAVALRQAGMGTAKGAVVDTAIIAGTMAVKRTTNSSRSATRCRSTAAASTWRG